MSSSGPPFFINYLWILKWERAFWRSTYLLLPLGRSWGTFTSSTILCYTPFWGYSNYSNCCYYWCEIFCSSERSQSAFFSYWVRRRSPACSRSFICLETSFSLNYFDSSKVFSHIIFFCSLSRLIMLPLPRTFFIRFRRKIILAGSNSSCIGSCF